MKAGCSIHFKPFQSPEGIFWSYALSYHFLFYLTPIFCVEQKTARCVASNKRLEAIAQTLQWSKLCWTTETVKHQGMDPKLPSTNNKTARYDRFSGLDSWFASSNLFGFAWMKQGIPQKLMVKNVIFPWVSAFFGGLFWRGKTFPILSPMSLQAFPGRWHGFVLGCGTRGWTHDAGG